VKSMVVVMRAAYRMVTPASGLVRAFPRLSTDFVSKVLPSARAAPINDTRCCLRRALPLAADVGCNRPGHWNGRGAGASPAAVLTKIFARARPIKSPGRPQPTPPGHGFLGGFRSGQRQPLRLFTPLVAIAPQIGDDRAELGDQSIRCRVRFAPGFRLVSRNGI
jgi:hypothetical protein